MDNFDVDGLRVIEDYLLTKGEGIVGADNKIAFKPLIDFALILYSQKANATNRLAMKFELEKFFMRRCMGEVSGHETQWVKVPKAIYDRVKSQNDQYRNDKNQQRA